MEIQSNTPSVPENRQPITWGEALQRPIPTNPAEIIQDQPFQVEQPLAKTEQRPALVPENVTQAEVISQPIIEPEPAPEIHPTGLTSAPTPVHATDHHLPVTAFSEIIHNLGKNPSDAALQQGENIIVTAWEAAA
jgi:hypothetical protein